MTEPREWRRVQGLLVQKGEVFRAGEAWEGPGRAEPSTRGTTQDAQEVVSGRLGKNKARMCIGHPNIWATGNRDKTGCLERRFWWKARRGCVGRVSESQNAKWGMPGEESSGQEKALHLWGLGLGCLHKGPGLPPGWAGEAGPGGRMGKEAVRVSGKVVPCGGWGKQQEARGLCRSLEQPVSFNTAP